MVMLQSTQKLSVKDGIKVLVHGGPGSKKTRSIITAPNPVIIACERNMLSLRNENLPMIEAYTRDAIKETIDWAVNSHERKQFDTICVDSTSKMCDIVLNERKAVRKDGRKAYGEMAEICLDHIIKLRYLPQCHVYFIAQQHRPNEGDNQIVKRPYFPGIEMNTKIPHEFDEIWAAGSYIIPGVQGEQEAFCTQNQVNLSARDNSGALNAYEPMNLTNLFNKIMQS